jgi:ribosome-associated translation inhibitor RaiA
MKIPFQLHFLDMPRSEAVEAKIQRKVQGLERYSGRIQRCEVWVESPHGHHRKGRLYAVRARLTIPQEEIAVDLQTPQEDVSVAIREAFDALRRRLQDSQRRRRGSVKAHPRAQSDASRRRAILPRVRRASSAD